MNICHGKVVFDLNYPNNYHISDFLCLYPLFNPSHMGICQHGKRLTGKQSVNCAFSQSEQPTVLLILSPGQLQQSQETSKHCLPALRPLLCGHRNRQEKLRKRQSATHQLKGRGITAISEFYMNALSGETRKSKSIWEFEFSVLPLEITKLLVKCQKPLHRV